MIIPMLLGSTHTDEYKEKDDKTGKIEVNEKDYDINELIIGMVNPTPSRTNQTLLLYTLN